MQSQERSARRLNRQVGRAMHDYNMLNDGDRVLVAVSGGIDSLVLVRLLALWQGKAPITYRLEAVHVDMEAGADGEPGPSALAVGAVLDRMAIGLTVLPALWRPEPPAPGETAATRDLCFRCARSRRTQLFDFARRQGCNTLAFGHHRDDIIETFFLNLTAAGNISTMSPRQELFSGRLALIRPLAYVDKEDIERFGADQGLAPIRSSCPLSERTRREEVHRVLADLYQRLPKAKENIFAALGNVRLGYLLRQGGGRRR